jgi:hypothetical protein
VVSRRFVKNSRCNGRLAVRTCYCRPARKSQRRTGRSIPPLVPEISPAAPNQHPGQGGLTPGLLLLSS